MFEDIDRRNYWLIFLVITNIISVGIVCFMMLKKDDVQLISDETIIVQITGEVNIPDVYELNDGMRLNDLVDKAGGFTENADIKAVNLALLLKDGMKITVPSLKDTEPDEAENDKININTADMEELMRLNGIGEVKALAIIAYREQNGPFTQIEDLMKVSGIGEKTFAKIKDDICC